jgi:hypothetical protein
MSDNMVFGVQDPETAETGYCSVLGALGQVFALSVYVGSRGLATYLDLAEGRVSAQSLDTMYCQECIQASFEDRPGLNERDHRIIKQLGLKFKGENQWPKFRDYTPGYLPWYITSSQAKFLTHALKQAGVVALRIRTHPDLLPKKRDMYFVRAWQKDGDNVGWSDSSLRAESPSKPARISAIPDARALNRARNIGISKNASWEIDLNYSPTVIQESSSQRPYYPKSLICIDHQGLAVDHHLFSHKVDPQEFQKRILALFQKVNVVPGRVMIKRTEVRDMLSPIATPLGIAVEMVDHLPAASDFFEHLFMFLNRQ